MSTTTPRTGNPPGAAVRPTARLFAGAALAAPVFLVVASVQVLGREGFDLTRHPLSLLSNGDLGWVQIANFVVTGLLVLAFAVGLRRRFARGRSGTWAPILFGLLGVGLVAAGVFVADPSGGFPPDAPPVTDPTWHSTAHSIAAALATDPAAIGCLVLARRLAGDGDRWWAAVSVATGLAAITLGWWPDADSISVRLACLLALLLAYISLTAVRLRRVPDRPARDSLLGARHRVA